MNHGLRMLLLSSCVVSFTTCCAMNEVARSARLAMCGLVGVDQALVGAVCDGDCHAVERLLVAGGDVNLLARHSVYAGASPLFLAILFRHRSVAHMLLEAGANPNVGKKGETPLYAAATRGDKDLVQALLRVGASHATRSAGETPLYAAARAGHTGVIQLLLDVGAEPNIRIPMSADTPLCAALRGGHAEAARLLLEGGAAPDSSVATTGESPLKLAEARRLDVITQLLSERLQSPHSCAGSC